MWAFTNNWERAERLYAEKKVPVGVTQLTRENPGGKQTINLTDVDELTIKNLIASGRYTREQAINKIAQTRSN